ncbi:MAG: hypothetical protein ACTHQ3_15885 [Motilibacteraceae bacterium]
MSDLPIYRTRVEATNPWHGTRHWIVLGCCCMAREFEEFREAINHAQRCSSVYGEHFRPPTPFADSDLPDFNEEIQR